MHVKVTKILGDNNKDDYYVNGYWVLGNTPKLPKSGFGLLVNQVVNSSEGKEESPPFFLLNRIDKIVEFYWGYLLVIGKEIWKFEVI